MTARKLVPTDVIPDDLDEPFWEACRSHQFLLHRCGTCGRHYWPASCCVEHGSEAMAWVESSGRGEVHTYTVFYQPYIPAWANDLPYNVAVVQLAEGPFFHTNIVDIAPDALRVGLPVEVVFDDVSDTATIPRFRAIA